jgi:hypothetical protein
MKEIERLNNFVELRLRNIDVVLESNKKRGAQQLPMKRGNCCALYWLILRTANFYMRQGLAMKGLQL